ncbi:MAG: aspartyl protease family protein [Gammaproteobacteria bacterium]|nr:aspartyl protease family protein [Gammaproteobacteria bacterium]MDH5652212.1 aspartyl protease family protein [Gammaproteobacteria bacterium]
MDTTVRERADLCFAAGNLAEAEKLYQQYRLDNPVDGQILSKLALLSFWRNDLAQAERLFHEAGMTSSWYQKCRPFNVMQLFQQAMLCIRQARWREAADLLRKAQGPIPVGPFRPLRARAAQAELFIATPPYQINGPDRVDLPFVVSEPLPVVEISVNGSEPAKFFLDTGAEELILDHAFARQITANIVDSAWEEYAGGKKGKTGYGKVDQVSLGAMLVQHVPVTTLDLQHISRPVFGEVDIKGVIGTRFLMHFMATINYPARQLTLRKSEKVIMDDFYRHAEQNSCHVIPFWLVETHLIFARGAFNERPAGMMFIDTGLAGGGFMTSRHKLEQDGVKLDWRAAKSGYGGGGKINALELVVDRVVLGEYAQRVIQEKVDCIVTEKELSIFKGSLGFAVEGLISHRFLRDFSLTFDFMRMQMVLQRK